MPADQKTRRAAITKALKAGGAKPRKGHLRLQAGEVFWYVDVRADSPAPTAELVFEVGGWLPAAGPEPEGGAIDCPLLADVPIGADVIAAAEALVALLAPVTDVAALRAFVARGALEGALVDKNLRAVLER
ncbi:hypothetical protein P5P86_08940 [Nocardioides sp. BP30]|uniref:hypothetical protein n=1 Tax=Nocardioides sp. BP30 TaxID=3036374 RepID=UPI0024688E0A|nr:hypothetical protein [Nocardioides sp. BP30]WGL53938.1 hypothetical protein P5P86_08940 [Nocardioides sp. BP30]